MELRRDSKKCFDCLTIFSTQFWTSCHCFLLNDSKSYNSLKNLIASLKLGVALYHFVRGGVLSHLEQQLVYQNQWL